MKALPKLTTAYVTVAFCGHFHPLKPWSPLVT